MDTTDERVHPVATGGNDPRGTNPEDRALAAFSCLARLDRELAMLAVHAESSLDDGRAEALEEAIRAANTARLCLRAATRDWIDMQAAYSKTIIVQPARDADCSTPREVRDAEKRPATAQDVTEGADIDSRGLVRVRDDEKLTDAERLAKWGYRLGEEPTPRQVRDDEKLAEAGSYLADLWDTDGE